uniref:Uncharacterized protein n=1 Tax=Arundo donax TaxID=35708 RepID=A0A0A9CA25_ARUDO
MSNWLLICSAHNICNTIMRVRYCPLTVAFYIYLWNVLWKHFFGHWMQIRLLYSIMQMH